MLVTTGTAEEYNFARLLKIIDELCDEEIIDATNLLVQGDDRGYECRNYKVKKMIPNSEFLNIMGAADIVISHAGTGTVTNALKMHKKVILFPRLAKYGEHIDDHQIELCNIFQEKGYVLVATDKEELKHMISVINTYDFREFSSNSINFMDILIEIIDAYEV